MLRQRLNSPEAERRAGAAIDSAASADIEALPVKEFSDLDSKLARQIARRWHELPVDRRRALVRAMVTTADDDLTSDYERALVIALSDSDRDVRSWALSGLRDHQLASTCRALVELLESEQVPSLRVQVIEVLDPAAERASSESLPQEIRDEILMALTKAANHDSSRQIRQAALAALGYFPGVPEVDALIEAAYASGDDDEVAHAVRAMGRSGVSRWREQIERTLMNPDEDLRAEAVQAVACSGDQGFAATMVQLAYEDDAVREDAIDALGEVGGDTAIRALRDLAGSQDEAIAERAETALDAATLIDRVGPARGE